jgi:hypothetical protein
VLSIFRSFDIFLWFYNAFPVLLYLDNFVIVHICELSYYNFYLCLLNYWCGCLRQKCKLFNIRIGLTQTIWSIVFFLYFLFIRNVSCKTLNDFEKDASSCSMLCLNNELSYCPSIFKKCISIVACFRILNKAKNCLCPYLVNPLNMCLRIHTYSYIVLMQLPSRKMAVSI